MINELRLGPGWLAAFILVSGSLSVGCAEGVTSVAGLFDGGTIDGDGLGIPDSGIGHDAARDTGGIIIVHGADTGVPGVDGTTTACTAGTTLCSGACVNTTSSPTDCGTCGNACAAGETCSGGVCSGSSSCPAGDTMCTSGCTELSTDPNNCGACGNVCPSGESCTSSACAASCTGGETMCSGVCTDTSSDSGNCGSCGNACSSGETCSSSSCQAAGDGTGSGTCTHSACEKGAALQLGCDDDEDGIVSAVCECADPDCCTSSWSNECVQYAEEYCEEFDCSSDPICSEI